MSDPFTQLTLPRKTVLRILLAATEPLSTIDLAKQADLQRSTTDNILSQLERAQWARSERGNFDHAAGPGTRLRLFWQLTDVGRSGAEARLNASRSSFAPPSL